MNVNVPVPVFPIASLFKEPQGLQSGYGVREPLQVISYPAVEEMSVKFLETVSRQHEWDLLIILNDVLDQIT